MSSEQNILAIPVDPASHKGVWTFAEIRHGQLIPTAFELRALRVRLEVDDPEGLLDLLTT